MSKESLIESFRMEMKDADQQTYTASVDSFTNLWDYQYGYLENLPADIEDHITNRAWEFGMLE
ncbi:hypothetical protein [Metabacillus arenae]|nr:hypothetical protein [Metabacillus arenae]